LQADIDPQTSAPGHAPLGAAWHTPLPSQVRADVNNEPLHIVLPHEVPFGGVKHAPLPSQVPGWPHGGALSLGH
jgi:hypothetical protein